jgi:hypothetical protein
MFLNPAIDGNEASSSLYTWLEEDNMHDIVIVGVPLLAILAGAFFNN